MLICELSILQFTVWKLLLQGKKWEGGGQRCKWIYSSNHRHRENKQFQLKHFLLRWEGEEARGSSAAKHFEHLHAYCVSLSGTQQAWQRTRFLGVLWALQREASNPAKKEKKKTDHNAFHHLCLSANLFILLLPDKKRYWWEGTKSLKSEKNYLYIRIKKNLCDEGRKSSAALIC